MRSIHMQFHFCFYNSVKNVGKMFLKSMTNFTLQKNSQIFENRQKTTSKTLFQIDHIIFCGVHSVVSVLAYHTLIYGKH